MFNDFNYYLNNTEVWEKGICVDFYIPGAIKVAIKFEC